MVTFHLHPLQVECTMFFQENPYTFETIDGLAVRLGGNIPDLRPIVEQLVSNTVLEKIGEGDQAIYKYVQPAMDEVKEAVLWREV